MKKICLLIPIFLIVIGCSSDDVYHTIVKGKVERSVNGEGIPNQVLTVMTRKSNGSGLFSYTEELDSKEVTTDENGNFSVALKDDKDAFVTVVYLDNDEYYGYGIFRNYPIDEPVIVKTDKYIKFKIYVNNTNPFNDEDFINVDFFAGLSNFKRTAIENFGTENTYYPEEPLPGGGTIGAYEVTSWTGMNVNSIISYSVRETADNFKIRWFIRKNGVETDGFTNDIPYDINQINSYTFEY